MWLKVRLTNLLTHVVLAHELLVSGGVWSRGLARLPEVRLPVGKVAAAPVLALLPVLVVLAQHLLRHFALAFSGAGEWF